jgi:hypothetical protein
MTFVTPDTAVAQDETTTTTVTDDSADSTDSSTTEESTDSDRGDCPEKESNATPSQDTSATNA